MTSDRARTLPSDPTVRQNIINEQLRQQRGLDRGVLSVLPLEDMALGEDFVLAPVDVGHLPFVLSAMTFIGYDPAQGVVNIGLYRVNDADLMPGAWLGRLSALASQQLAADPYEYCLPLANDKVIDRTAAAWFVAVTSNSPTAVVRGSQTFTPPAFSAWSLPSKAGLPNAVVSKDMTIDPRLPYIGLLTRTGLRLRGTGKLGA